MAMRYETSIYRLHYLTS